MHNNTDRYADRIRIIVKSQEPIQVKVQRKSSVTQDTSNIMQQIYDVQRIINALTEKEDASHTSET